MAKYCTKCGSELKSGICPKCKDAKSNEETSISVLTSDIIGLIKGMFIKPVDTMKAFIHQRNFNQALISLGICAIAMAFLVCILLKESINNTIGMNVYGFHRHMNIPYIRVFLITIVMAMAFYAFLAWITYLISTKCFKSKTSYKKMIAWLGATFSIMIVVYLAASICILIHPTLAMIVFISGSLLNTYYMYQGLCYACDVDKNQLGYVLMPSILITIFVIGYVIPMLLS